MRSEPPVSDPRATTTEPLATAAAEPDDEPPEMKSKIPWIADSAVHRVVAGRLIGEFRHRGIADAPAAGAIEQIEHSRLRAFYHRQRLSKSAMWRARGRHKDILCRVRHSVENTERRRNCSTFESDKCIQPRLEPARKIACACGKPRMLCGIKPRPIAKPQSHYVCSFRMSHGRSTQ